MAFEITRVDVWAGEVLDRPGALADKLEALQHAGANLDFTIVRPSADMSGAWVLFVAPLVGADQIKAAEEVGVQKSGSLHTLRIVGPDRPGLIAGIARTLADAGIEISGLSAAALEDRCLLHIRLESGADAKRAARILAPRLA